MASMSEQEQQALAQKLSQMKFSSAQSHLMGMDKKSRLRYFRSNQEVNKWLTAYDLPTQGIRVTLVESKSTKEKGISFFTRLATAYALSEVRVEALAEKKGA